MAASWAGLWRYGADGWQLIPQVIGGVVKIYQDQDGTMWACGSLGMWHYEADGWQLHSDTGMVWDIYQDRDGTMWARGGKGIWRYEADGWQLQVPLEMVAGYFELEDQYGNLWLGGEDGVRRKSGTGKDEVWFHFDRLQ